MSKDTMNDKGINDDYSDYMMKAGLHHFMDLEERTDLLNVSSQDPLDNTIVVSLDDSEDAAHSDNSVVDAKNDNDTEKFYNNGGCDYNIDCNGDTSQERNMEIVQPNSEKDYIPFPEEKQAVLATKRTKPRKRRKSRTLGDTVKKKKLEKQSLTCQICNVQKKSLKELNQHFSEHIRKSDNKFECSSCDEVIATYGSYIEHIKTHKKVKKKKSKKSFKCEICSKSFQFRCLLKDHRNLHTGYRPYLCSNCGKAFSLKASLKQHSRIHGTIKKHKCVYCEFSVYVKADLIKHIRTHTGERPYICEICGEGYIQSSHLVVHKRSHSGERPYKCDLCNRGFTKKGDVIRHRRIHTGELPYLCQVCGKAFRQSTQCSNHVKHHHPGTVDGKLNVPGYIPHEHNCIGAKINDN